VPTNGELIYAQEARITTTTIKEITTFGVRLEQNIQGAVRGRINGLVFMTSNQLWKPDGSREGEGRGVITTNDGEKILIRWKGAGTGSARAQSGKGGLAFQTSSKRLAWLNSTRGVTKGKADWATGEWKGKVYSVK
jgi:hypothetical protein